MNNGHDGGFLCVARCCDQLGIDKYVGLQRLGGYVVVFSYGMNEALLTCVKDHCTMSAHIAQRRCREEEHGQLTLLFGLHYLDGKAGIQRKDCVVGEFT